MNKKDCQKFDLNKEQYNVVKFGKGTLLVEAGPGSGKTTVIVARIKHLIREKNVPPESFLVITFTRKAAESLKLKLKDCLEKEEIEKMQISTIHSFCLKFLKSRNQSVNLLDDDSEERKILFVQKHKKDLGFIGNYPLKNGQIPKVVDKFGEYTNFKVKSDKLIRHLKRNRPFSQCYVMFTNEHEYFTNEQIENKGLKEDWYNARFQQVARAYPIYLDLLDENSLVDYNTLQLKTLEELKSNPKTPYTTILIDEFQDTDPLQFEIFKILREKVNYFTAVGDVDQRIYSFRSTFKDYFKELENKKDATRISLNCNYRSTENIVDLTDKFIKYQRDENSLKDLKAANNIENGGYNNPSFIIETPMPQKRDEKKQAYIEEADKIFEIIKDIEKYTKAGYKDIAVLYRKHSSQTVSYLVDKLKEARIPFSIKGQADLKDQKEVKAIIIMLWYITRKLDDSYIFLSEEYDWLNLKGFYDDELEGIFWHLTDETKQYLKELQETFEDEVVKSRNKINPYKEIKPFRTTGNEKEDVLVKIFKEVKKPVIDLNKIHENDRKFFAKLNKLRKMAEKNSIEILEVYYELLAMSTYFENVEKNMSEVLNLAMLTQTISNYEEYISQTFVQGLYYFLRRMIRGYSSNYEDKDGIQLMTVHAAKGLEFPVVIVPSLQKDEFPMKVKEEKHGYTTPNKYLTYKCVDDDENQAVSVEEESEHYIEEEERVVYVAMTRAADLLILSCLGENPEGIKCIKSDLKPYSSEELKEVTVEKDFKKEDIKEPVVLNYSKYTKFLSCPFKFNLGYNLGFRRPGIKAATNRGTVFHEIMENVNQKLKEGHVVSEEELIKITQDEFKSRFDIDSNLEYYEEFQENVIYYYNEYSKDKEVLETELAFEIDRGKYILNGAIDLIYKTAENEIVILDYKYAKYDEDHIGGYTKQLYIYASALRQLPKYKDYKIKKAITHFVLGDGENRDYQHKVEIDEDVMKYELNKLNEVADCISNGNFPKKPEKPYICNKCSYRKFCKPEDFANELIE
jgi:DNA helicase-2/ATP-dependent DNA helicase PcrA